VAQHSEEVVRTVRAEYEGASKSFYLTADPQVMRVVFKDAIHGAGRSAVVAGTGQLRAQFCYHFYRLLEREGIATHLAQTYCGKPLPDHEREGPDGLLVRRLEMVALELICRYVGRGQWSDPHKWPIIEPGYVFADPVFECCLKWRGRVPNLTFDRLSPGLRRCWRALERTPLRSVLLPADLDRDDPRIGPDLAVALNGCAIDPRLRGHLLYSRDEWEQLRTLALRVNRLLRDFLASEGWVLEDGKFEVGVVPGASCRDFVVADEYSQDSCRIRTRAGESLTKDLFRQSKSPGEIFDGYARLASAMRAYAG
jgi:phosphoribosylaminoimidazole-succinocarboxamide synthase